MINLNGLNFTIAALFSIPIAKLITIIGIYFSLSSLSWADDLRDKLIFVQPNAAFDKYNPLNDALKDENSTEFLTYATRKEWLSMAHNHMLTIETGITKVIYWLTIPHFDKQ